MYFASPKPRIIKKIGSRRMRPMAKPVPLPKDLASLTFMTMPSIKLAPGRMERKQSIGYMFKI